MRKIMALVKIVTDWIFLFGFSFIQCHVTSFPYLDCAWGWSLQNIKQLCWSCLHCFLDFGLIHHQDHVQNLPIKMSSYYLTKFDSNLFDLYFSIQ